MSLNQRKKWILDALKTPQLAPSILSADFSRLGEEIAAVEEAGAKWIHVDVMDGHFVPNLTIGPPVVSALRKTTKLPLDCHLMVEHPENWLEPFAKAGADVITIHAEAAPHLDRQLHRIAELGCLAGVSINPATTLTVVEEVLDIVDLVLVMSVNPGFGGQSFIESALSKIQRLSDIRGSRRFVIEVDGGINLETAPRARAAGADVFVAGNAVFGPKNLKTSVKGLQRAIGGEA